MGIERLNRGNNANQFSDSNEVRNNKRAGENQSNSAVILHQTDTARQKAVSHRERNASLNPNEALSAKRLAEQNKEQNIELTTEQKKRREIDRRFPFRTLTEVPGEMTRADVARAKGILTSNLDVPPGATAEEVQQLQIAAAKKDYRIEMARTGQTMHLQEFEAGGRTARIKSEVRFQQESTILKNAASAFAEGLTAQQSKQLNIRTNKQLAREIREMKLELAETGASRTQRAFVAANGKTYGLEVKADWRQTTEFRVVDEDARTHRYEWVEAQKPEANKMSNDDGGRVRFRSRHDDDSDASQRTSTRFHDLGNGRILTRRSRHDDGGEFDGTGPTREFTERIEKIHASRAAAEKQLNHQLEIESFVREVRAEMVANNHRSFSDRKIIGQKYAYEVDAGVTFDQRSQLLNPKEPNAVEKYIAENPHLTPAEIKNLNADFSKMRRATIEQTVSSLKEQLAQTGERAASTVVDISGEKHRITVRADWRVKAEHHSIDEADVERLMRDTLVFNGGDDFKTMYKFGGRRFEGEAAVDFDLKLERLNFNQPSQLDLLRQNKHLLSPEEFAKAKRQLGESKQFQLGATVLDMQRDMARAGNERMTRVVTVNGEKYRVTASADWDVEADRKRSNPFGTILKIVAGVAGVATGQMWIPAAVNFVDSAARGNGLGMLTSGLSFVGGVTSGVVSQVANTSSQVISAGSVIANPNAGLFDKILAGVDIGANVAKFSNPNLANRLNDISDWGGKANMLIKGDAAGLFQSVATEYIGKALRNELQQVDRDASSPKPITPSTQAEIATGKNAAAIQKAVNRVRQVYDQIYDRMDERGRTAANQIIVNARRRGIDPNLAMAQVNNLIREGNDLDALIRADAERRGVPVNQVRNSLNVLVNEQRTPIDEIRRINNANINNKSHNESKPILTPTPTADTGQKGEIIPIPVNNKELNGSLQPAEFVPVPSFNPTEQEVQAAVLQQLQRMGFTPLSNGQLVPPNSDIIRAEVSRNPDGSPQVIRGTDGSPYINVEFVLANGSRMSISQYASNQFDNYAAQIEQGLANGGSIRLENQQAVIAELERYRPFVDQQRLDALQQAVIVNPAQRQLASFGFLAPNQIDGQVGSLTNNAAASFQGFNGILTTGQLNEQTLRALNSEGHRTRDDAVALQTRLRDLGYYTGEIDGIWGPQTSAAVRQFQQNNSWGGRELSVSGLMDSATASSILQRSAVPNTTRPNNAASNGGVSGLPSWSVGLDPQNRIEIPIPTAIPNQPVLEQAQPLTPWQRTALQAREFWNGFSMGRVNAQGGFESNLQTLTDEQARYNAGMSPAQRFGADTRDAFNLFVPFGGAFADAGASWNLSTNPHLEPLVGWTAEDARNSAAIGAALEGAPIIGRFINIPNIGRTVNPNLPATRSGNLSNSVNINQMEIASGVNFGAAQSYIRNAYEGQVTSVNILPTTQFNVHGTIGLNPNVEFSAIPLVDTGSNQIFSPSPIGGMTTENFARDFNLSTHSAIRLPRFAPDVTLRREIPNGAGNTITQPPVLINGRELNAAQVEELFGNRETISLSELLANGRRMGVFQDGDAILLNSCLADNSQTVSGAGTMTLVDTSGATVRVDSILNGDINRLASDPEFREYQQNYLQQSNTNNTPINREGANNQTRAGTSNNYDASFDPEAVRIAQQLGDANDIPLDQILGLANSERQRLGLPPLNASLRQQFAGATPRVFRSEGGLTEFGRNVYNIQRLETNSNGQPMVYRVLPGRTEPDFGEATAADPPRTQYFLWRDARTLANGTSYSAGYIPIDNGTNIHAGHIIPAAEIVQELISGGARNGDIRDLMEWPANYRLEFGRYNMSNGSGGVTFPNVLVSPYHVLWPRQQ